MAASKAFFFIAAVAVLIELSTAITSFTVGAPSGNWDLSTDYGAWASSLTFAVGDNLLFEYDRSVHDVLEVTKANYDSCTTSSPLATHKTGQDVILLLSAGKRYFICGTPGHCRIGMKVEIDVVAASAQSPPGIPSSSPGANGLQAKAAATFGLGMLMVVAL